MSTTSPEIEALARQLYNECPTPKPTWEQAGPVCQGEWRRMALRKSEGDPKWWSIFPREDGHGSDE